MATKTEDKAPAAEVEETVIVEPGQSVAEAMASSPFDAALGDSAVSGDVIEDGDYEAATTEEYSAPTGMGGLTADPVFDRDEVSLPRLRLAQGLTPEVQEGTAKPGQWVLSGHEAVDYVTFIPQLMGTDWGHRDKDTGAYTACVNSRCPGREWGPNDPRTGKGVPPWCTRIYRYLGYSVEHGVTAEFHLSRSAERVAKELNAIIAVKRLGNFAIQLGKQTQQGPRGAYFMPAFKQVSVPASEMATARMLVSGQ